MKVNSPVRLSNQRIGYGQALVRRLSQILVVCLLQGGILFFSAGQLDWWMAWVYLGLNFGRDASK